MLLGSPVHASEPALLLVRHGPCPPVSHEPPPRPAGPCTGAQGRDFLLGIRRGQAVGAHVPSWCSRHGWTVVAPNRSARLVSLRLGQPDVLEGTGWTAPTASMCQDAVVTTRAREPPAMSISMIGLDTAKSTFQLHGIDATGKVQLKRKLRRDELIAFFEQHPRCTVVMEACGAAHHWARVLIGLGYEVKLIASEAVRPFVKRGKKNDPADAAAICAAASRPDAKFVVAKSLEQQGVLALHSVRSLLVKQHTMLANAMRGLATEFGLVVPKGMDKLKELMTLVEEDKSFPEQA